MSSAFKKQTAIYLQIAEDLCDNILRGVLQEDGKILSIRETAIQLEVNPNTVQRAYEWLQQQELIFTKRGLGYFVSGNAKEKVRRLKRQQFIEEVLPEVFKNMQLLNITQEEINTKYKHYLKQWSNENE